MRVLVVEDDQDLSRQLKQALGDAGYVVDLAHDGEDGHFLGDTEPYDAVVLDIGLPVALVLTAASFTFGFLFIRSPAWMPPSNRARRGRADLIVRAVITGVLVAVVVTVSDAIGPAATGVALVFPVSLTTISWIMHRRYGGAAAAAVLGATLRPLFGFLAFLLALHLLAEPIGTPLALAAAVGCSVLWSLVLLARLGPLKRAHAR